MDLQSLFFLGRYPILDKMAKNIDLSHFVDRARYNAWANDLSGASVGNLAHPGRALTVLGHIAATVVIWLDRLDDSVSTTPVWPAWSAQVARDHLLEGSRRLEELAADTQSLARKISYTNTKGQNFENTVADVLEHVLMHSMYHRGQVALLVRSEGGTPAVTDYIAYKRR